MPSGNQDKKSLIREYLGKYRKPVIYGLVALVIVDFLEVIPPLLLKQAVDVVTEKHPARKLVSIAFAYVGIAILQGIGRYAWRMYLIRASLLSGRDLRNRFAAHLFSLSASFFDRRPIGDLISLATTDVEAVRMTLGAGLLTMADALFYFLTVPIAMYLLSPKLMLLAFIPLPIIPWVVMRNQKEIHRRFEKVQDSFARISALAQEGINGIRVIKAFAKEDEQLRRLRDAGEAHIQLSLDLARVQSAFGPTLDFAMSFGLVFLLYIGGKSLIDNGEAAFSLGTFIAFQRYIQKMVWPMAALGIAISTYQRSLSSSARLKAILETRTDVPEPEASHFPETAFANAGTWRTEGRVELRDLSFQFPAGKKTVLKNISLVIEPGERVAFIGAIGAGKTALLSLLPRLYPVERGMLCIDGVDVNDWPLDLLRAQVGYVSQEVFLFSETVIENIAYGLQGWREWVMTHDAPIEEASRLACVHDDVLGLTGSYRTRLGERGVNLSGGQKQRLTIARAVVKQPSILVLDDALSSVDVQTEEKILRGLRSRSGRNTELISAHRISTIQDADRIVVLNQGSLAQMGTHAQLIQSRSGLYHQLYHQQRLRADLESYTECLS